MPLGLSTRMSHIYDSTDRYEQLEEGDMVSFFCSGPRTGSGASSENLSLPTTGLQKGQQR